MFKVMTWNVENLFKAGSASGPATTAVYEEKRQGLASMIPYHLLHASQWRDPRRTPVRANRGRESWLPAALRSRSDDAV